MLDDYFRQYGLILILTIVAVVVPVGMLMLSWLFTFIRIRPSKPSPVKSSVYECGVEPIGPGRWVQFNFRYYTYALLFVIFDVETVFLYPWAIRFKQLGLFALFEMLVFVLILVVGLAYAWRKRALEWEQ
ncbi:MAG: NADH-quinone oxidoreductase subunit A [Dehalococcoidia bacterium]|nr:NADH-quinone oxidoreductase subunit A [Dehalococcoidia bacterium]